MIRSFATASLFCLLAIPASADPDADMGAFMQRQAYRSSYETMLMGQPNLPKWMATPDAIADATTLKISKRVVDGETQSILEMCKPDQCENTGLVVMFSAAGSIAKGLLSDKDDIFLGKPTDDEQKVLLKIKNSD